MLEQVVFKDWTQSLLSLAKVIDIKYKNCMKHPVFWTAVLVFLALKTPLIEKWNEIMSL
jgi:hypothetical protein